MNTVSIIVPVYNAEKFLDKCVVSIMNQTHKEIEIILVNDGSGDSSGDICNEYAVLDSRVRVINKENGGVSSARNRGIDEAKGNYLCFADSDDVLNCDYVQKMFEEMIKSETDLVVCSIENIYPFRKTLSQTNSEVISIGEDKLKSAELVTSVLMYSPWNKLYKKEIIMRNKLCFNETIHYAEDAIFVFEYMLHCRKISLLNDVLYQYNQATINSATSKFHLNMDIFLAERFRSQQRFLDLLDLNEDMMKSELAYIALDNFRTLSKYYLFAKMTSEEKLDKYKMVYATYSLYFLHDNNEKLNEKNPKLYRWYMKHFYNIKSGNIELFIRKYYSNELVKTLIVKKNIEKISKLIIGINHKFNLLIN